MEEKTWNRFDVLYFGSCIGVIIFAILIIIFKTTLNTKEIENFDKGYKQGQIDCLNGVQNYDKIIKQDTIYIKIR